MTSHLTTLTEKIQKACPELMELSFGCKVVHYYDHYDGSHADKCTVIQQEGNDILVVSHGQYDLVLEKEYIPEDFEILGHPIRLEHVLRSMEDVLKDKFKMNYHRNEQKLNLLKLWDLTKDLSDQTEDVWEFLDNLLT